MLFQNVAPECISYLWQLNASIPNIPQTYWLFVVFFSLVVSGSSWSCMNLHPLFYLKCLFYAHLLRFARGNCWFGNLEGLPWIQASMLLCTSHHAIQQFYTEQLCSTDNVCEGCVSPAHISQQTPVAPSRSSFALILQQEIKVRYFSGSLWEQDHRPAALKRPVIITL